MTDREKLIELHKQAFEHLLKTGKEFSHENYADYLLANGVFILPCKVGDTVYRIFNGEIYEHKVSNTLYRGLQSRWQIDCIPFMAYVYDELGNTVFLTKEEAEQALKEWKNG